MSLVEINRREFKRTTRIWFRCDDCGTYGDVTSPAADEVVALMRCRHECDATDLPSQRVRGAELPTADWCVSDGSVSVCGTRMREYSRDSEGVKWCFQCRTRAEFHRIITVPDGDSWYGPNIAVKCSNCNAIDGDMFPGGYREWDEL